MSKLCIYEDRADGLIGLKILLASLARHCPENKVTVFTNAEMARSLDTSSAQVEIRLIKSAEGWNIKPTVLQELLNEGAETVTWIDSDVVLTRPVDLTFKDLDASVFVGAEEQPWRKKAGSASRVVFWGLKHGRDIPTVNSCILRVTSRHLDLLAAWKDLLKRDDYLAFQKREWNERPIEMLGDQDALTALLGSDRFAGIPLHLLPQGIQIAQCHNADGYSARFRIGNLRDGLPPIVHAQGEKPWRNKRRDLYLELSPYIYACYPFFYALTPQEQETLKRKRLSAHMLNALTGGNANLAGLIPAVGREAARRAYRLLKPANP